VQRLVCVALREGWVFCIISTKILDGYRNR